MSWLPLVSFISSTNVMTQLPSTDGFSPIAIQMIAIIWVNMSTPNSSLMKSTYSLTICLVYPSQFIKTIETRRSTWSKNLFQWTNLANLHTLNFWLSPAKSPGRTAIQSIKNRPLRYWIWYSLNLLYFWLSDNLKKLRTISAVNTKSTANSNELRDTCIWGKQRTIGVENIAYTVKVFTIRSQIWGSVFSRLMRYQTHWFSGVNIISSRFVSSSSC